MICFVVLHHKKQDVAGVRGTSSVHKHVSTKLDRLRQHFERLTGEHGDTRFSCGCMIGSFAAEMSSRPKLRSAIGGHFEGWNEAIAEHLRQAQQAGELTVERDPEVVLLSPQLFSGSAPAPGLPAFLVDDLVVF